MLVVTDSRRMQIILAVMHLSVSSLTIFIESMLRDLRIAHKACFILRNLIECNIGVATIIDIGISLI